MQNKDLETLTNNIQIKIGDDASGLIADDIATLITDCTQTNILLENKDKEIEKLKKDKENLLKVNGNLLQQVSMGEDTLIKKQNIENTKPKYSLKNAFDSKGNFK